MVCCWSSLACKSAMHRITAQRRRWNTTVVAWIQNKERRPAQTAWLEFITDNIFPSHSSYLKIEDHSMPEHTQAMRHRWMARLPFLGLMKSWNILKHTEKKERCYRWNFFYKFCDHVSYSNYNYSIDNATLITWYAKGDSLNIKTFWYRSHCCSTSSVRIIK